MQRDLLGLSCGSQCYSVVMTILQELAGQHCDVDLGAALHMASLLPGGDTGLSGESPWSRARWVKLTESRFLEGDTIAA